MSDFINTVDVFGDDVVTDSILNRSITEYNDNNVTKIGKRAFSGCSKLISVNCPIVNTIDENAFSNCGLITATLPALTKIAAYAFSYCTTVTTIDISVPTSINTRSFENCSKLVALILRNTTAVSSLKSSTAFASTPITSGGTGYIYVPSALVDSYKTATNWSALAAQIRAIEDYPEITGG